MSAGWQRLAEEIARWRDAGRTLDLWWRDDDAARRTPALARLLALAARRRVPVALAVVPLSAEPALLAGLAAGVCVLQHGADHVNRAAPGEKKTEFSASEPAQTALERLAAARGRLQAQAPGRFLPVLAPPWNRLPRPLVAQLAGAGFIGLSQYGARANAEPSPGVRQVNTHVDIIAWKSGRGFVGEEAALQAMLGHLRARRSGAVETREPTGLLTHHACHDEAAWNFLERLLETTSEAAGVHWRDAAALFR